MLLARRYHINSDNSYIPSRDEKEIDFAEQLESVAYVLCGDDTITFPKFCQIWLAKGVSITIYSMKISTCVLFYCVLDPQVLEKLYRLIDADAINLVSTNQIMEFISNLTNSRWAQYPPFSGTFTTLLALTPPTLHHNCPYGQISQQTQHINCMPPNVRALRIPWIIECVVRVVSAGHTWMSRFSHESMHGRQLVIYEHRQSASLPTNNRNRFDDIAAAVAVVVFISSDHVLVCTFARCSVAFGMQHAYDQRLCLVRAHIIRQPMRRHASMIVRRVIEQVSAQRRILSSLRQRLCCLSYKFAMPDTKFIHEKHGRENVYIKSHTILIE